MPIAAELYYTFYRQAEKDTLPVVLIHGAAGNYLSWATGIRRLKGFEVYTLDLPGHGKSAAQDAQQSVAGFAKVVINWLDTVGLHRAVFVGHSMGGAIALELGISYPEHVLGLGLVSTGVRLRITPKLLGLASNPATFHKAVEFMAANSFGKGASLRLVELATKRMVETRPSVLQGDLRACDDFDVKDQINNLGRPVVVICGDEDKMTPLHYSQFLAGTIPDAQLHIIPDAGHMVILEKPNEVAAALISFLRSIEYRPGEEN